MSKESGSTRSTGPQRGGNGPEGRPASFVLASASPRRATLLREAGQSFEIRPSDVEEERMPGETPESFARRTARDKAEAVARKFPGRWILGADTIVVLGSEILGKPAHPEEARSMLRRLSERAHEVLTAVALRDPDGRFRERVVRTEVVFRRLGDGEIDRYVATEEPLDKAGAYGIQGEAGSFVARLGGSYTNVVGLPMDCVRDCLREAGLWAEGECSRRK